MLAAHARNLRMLLVSFWVPELRLDAAKLEPVGSTLPVRSAALARAAAARCTGRRGSTAASRSDARSRYRRANGVGSPQASVPSVLTAATYVRLLGALNPWDGWDASKACCLPAWGVDRSNPAAE